MVIIGAKGFAKELLELLYEDINSEIIFFDNVNLKSPDFLYEKFKIIKSFEVLENYFQTIPDFVIGTGGTHTRFELANTMTSLGGKQVSLVSNKASVGHFGTEIGIGSVIFTNAIITNDVKIGSGVIINKAAIVSHDVVIGDYCEISPGARLLGRVKVGDFTMIGANAVILPDINIGNNCIVGAGAIVTTNVPDNTTVFGVPAKIRIV